MISTLKQESTEKYNAIDKPEISLLLCCSRTRLNHSIKKQIKLLVKQDIDWQYLISLASQHGVVPLLFNSLNNTCPELLPADILTNLRTYFQVNAQRNLFRTAQLLKFLSIFEANGIDAIPFKGATLTASAYGNMALRQFNDIDVLIRKEHAKKATEILIDLGFNPPQKNTEAIDKPYLENNYFLESNEYQGSYDLYNPKTNVAFEMHWSLTTKQFPFSPTFQDLWENTEPVIFAGRKVPQFTKEILLIYLCVHASKPKHTWSELKWICDLSELIQSNPGLDWEKVHQKAKIWGCDRIVNIGLLLAHNLLNLELPEHILLKINQDKVAQRLVKEVVNRIFTKEFMGVDEHIFVVKSRERLQDKIYCLSYFIFAPTAKEWNYIALPKSISFLYYLIRPYRLVKEYLTSAATRKSKIKSGAGMGEVLTSSFSPPT